jgi:hypothetical protein
MGLEVQLSQACFLLIDHVVEGESLFLEERTDG